MFVEIDNKLFHNLEQIADIMNTEVSDIIDNALNKELKRYTYNGELKAVKAKLWTNRIECNIRSDVMKVFEDVYVIGKAEIYGNAYYKVIYEGSLISVPFESITFYNEEDKYKVI